MKTTLYAIDKKGGSKVWSTWVNGPEIHVQHGKLGGKLQLKVFTATPKNEGRANATTAGQQAVFEMASRVSKQLDKGYRHSIEEAKEAESEQLLPMLASDYTKVGHSIKYPCFVSPKLDGVRCIARVSEDSQGITFTSRGGKEYNVPAHLSEELLALSKKTGEMLFDGEIYIHGVPLQNIVSAVKKPNSLTPSLQFWIFDIPSDKPFVERNRTLEYLNTQQTATIGNNVQIVLNALVSEESLARMVMDHWLTLGYEGIMLRNESGLYEWNHRSRDLQKWKDFLEDEFLVVDFEPDALDEAVYHMALPGGKVFKGKPRGNHEQRSTSNYSAYVGKWVTVRYQQLTNDGVPQFPVIVNVRECNANGDPVE